MPTPQLLIVEDDHKLRGLLAEYLRANEFEVDTEENGLDALIRLRADPPDVVVLDLMLPGLDGFEVCRKAREFYDGGIIMLTARQTIIDQAVGLEIGADDYVIKPCEPRVLLARVRSLLRRLDKSGAPSQDADTIRLGALEIKRGRREVCLNDQVLEMTSTEFDIMYLLAQRVGESISRDELNVEVRGVPYDGIDRSIDIHVSRIRRKLADAGGKSGWIKSVRSVGYMLVRFE